VKRVEGTLDRNPESAQPDEDLFTAANEACATILEGKTATNQVEKREITVLESFDDEEIVKLKRAGKKTALRIAIKGKQDENLAVQAAELGADYVIIDCRDWRVIPLENIIAKTRGKTRLIAQVSTAEDARQIGDVGAGNRRRSP
jgi:3-dehydroquinate synthase class II